MSVTTKKGAARRPSPRAKKIAIEHNTATCPCDSCKAVRAKDHAPCLIGYARVSTVEQTTRQQVDALGVAGCAQIFIDEAVSGAKASRPELDKCLAALQSGDTLVIWKLDRLGRSLRDLLDVADTLQRRGVALRSLTEAIDTATPAGKMLYAVLGAVAQFERDIITARINLALDAKKRRGEPLGRKRKLTPDSLATARRELDAGTPSVRVARTLGVSKATLYASLAREAQA
jgi:DNA invertase Pin-like site-specific DNA recombinase